MKKLILLAFLAALPMVAAFGQGTPAGAKAHTKEVFLFHSSDDMFYMRESPENQAQWARLSSFVDTHKGVIRNGSVKVYVSSYSTSLATAPSNRLLAKTMANRVKTELILKNGLKEEDFKTVNLVEQYEGKTPVVVVEITIPNDKPEEKTPVRAASPATRREEPAPVKEETPVVAQDAPAPAPAPAKPEFSRWSLGLNVGVPLFDGDFSSFRNKLELGYLVGLQATYQISPVFGLSLTGDYGQNKSNSPKYGVDYMMNDQGVGYFFSEQGATEERWGDLYGKTKVYGGAFHVDVNLVRLFSRREAAVNVILSPGVYGQCFDTKIYDKSSDDQFVTKELSNNWDVNFGSDLAFRFRTSSSIDLQLKGTGIWIRDNLFDNIDSRIEAKDNWMWAVQAGIIFKLGGNSAPNMLYRDR